MDSMSMWQRTFWMGIASQCDSISPTSAKCAGKRKKKVGWKRLLTSWIPLPWPVDGVHYHYGAKKCHPLQHLHPLQYLHQLHTSIVLETSFMRTKKNGHDAICFHGVWWNLWKRAGIDQLTRILGLKTWFLFIIDNFLYGFFFAVSLFRYLGTLSQPQEYVALVLRHLPPPIDPVRCDLFFYIWCWPNNCLKDCVI